MLQLANSALIRGSLVLLERRAAKWQEANTDAALSQRPFAVATAVIVVRVVIFAIFKRASVSKRTAQTAFLLH
jgi:hypothetical protein